MDFQVSGFFGLLILIGDIWAVVSVLGSNAETLHKVLWILLIILLPFLGLVIWFFAGPRSAGA